jgi:hypothetical protein
MNTLTTYGPGGFDPTHPDDNVVDVREVKVAAEPKSIAELIADALSDLSHNATVADLVSALRTALGEQ